MAQLKDLLVNGSARVIGSLYANLSGNVLNFGVCSTAAATAAKTVTTNGTFELITGSKILVLFSETDSSNAPTLNVNGTGAKSIKINASDGIGKGFLVAQQYYWFIYDGTNWRTAGAVITLIIPTQYGGTGNSSFTANRVIYSNTATKLASGSITTDGAYLGNVNYLSINAAHLTNYRAYINGTSYFNGNATFNGNVLPNTTNTYDLGSSSLNWKKLFLSDIIYNYPGASIDGGGNFWYCTIITINTNAKYINDPIVLEVSGRGIPFTLLLIHFLNSGNVDPELLHFTTNCSNRFYIKKTNTNQWTVYCQYTERWGSLYVHRITGNGASRATISLANVESLPADCILVSSDFVINGNLIKKLTIQANGVQKGLFNNSADVTVNLGNVVQDFTGANSGNAASINADTFAGMTRQLWLNTIYPIGSIYISVSGTSPETLFGGTWEALGGRFLIGKDDTYIANSTGGNTTHTHTIAHTHTLNHTHTTPATTTGGTAITVAQMPSHKHSYLHYVSTDCGYIPANSRANSIVVRSDANGISNTGGTFTDRIGSVEYSGNLICNTGGGSAHTHSQVATTTSDASNATTSAASNANSGSTSTLPPYLVVYMWKRIA